MQSILCRSCISRQVSLSFRNNPICFRTLSLRSLNPFRRTLLTYAKPLNIVYKTNPRFFQQYSRVYQQSVRTIVSQSESNPPIPLRTFALFSLSLVGIIAAYMSVSWVLTSTNAYKDGMEIMKNCPKVYDYTGFPFNRVGRVKGKCKNGEVVMTIKLQGKKGIVLATLYGKEKEKNQYEILDLHVKPVVSSKLSEKKEEEEDLTFTILEDHVCYQQLFKKFTFIDYSPEIEQLMKDAPISEQQVKEQEASKPAEPSDASEPGPLNKEAVEKQKMNPLTRYWLDKPWYYKIIFAVGLGLVGGFLLGFGLLNLKVRPSHNTAFQAAFKLIKNDAQAQQILGNKIKAVGTIKGKAEESWANFTIKLKGSKCEAMANVQGIRENQDWKFTVLSLDTKEGKYYIKK